MPTAEDAPTQTPMRDFYLRLGQILLAIALAFFLLKGAKLTDTVWLMALFFGIAGLLMLVSARHIPREAYVFSVLKKLFYPLMISLMALMLSAVLIGIPLVNFGTYMGYFPLIFVMILALEAII